jgi:flagellar protein FlbD
MIELTNLSGKSLLVNPQLIKMIDFTPDSVLVFIDGSRFPVREAKDKLIQLFSQYREQKNIEGTAWISQQS